MASLLSLPVELRLQILSLVLFSETEYTPTTETERIAKESLDYERADSDLAGRFIANARPLTLFLRNIDPSQYRLMATLTWPCWRTIYNIRSNRRQARTMCTTYECTNKKEYGNSTGVLLLNNQLHQEAARLFYGGLTFDFDAHIEAIVPFLSDITAFSRSCIKSVSFIKQALPYQKTYDWYEWLNAMRYLQDPKNGMCLQRIQVGIVAGRPGPDGWQDVVPYDMDDIEALIFDGSMRWLKELIAVPTTHGITVVPMVEHCPPASNSEAMANYIRFSASIETGLSGFLSRRASASSEKQVV